MSSVPNIGFDRRIRLQWLEQAAGLAMGGSTEEDIRRVLHEILQTGESPNETEGLAARKKTVMILMRIWVAPRPALRAMHCQGLELLQRLPTDVHLPVHWGMAMATYPFFSTVSEHVGRVLRLQGNAGASQIQRRLREDLGDRQIVARAGRHVLRSLVDWGALVDSDDKGVYQSSPARPIEDPELSGWLVEAVLRGSGAASSQLPSLARSPALFPFTLSLPPVLTLEATGRLEVSRQGLDQDVVALRPHEARVELHSDQLRLPALL
jgi:hypothetical protein